MLSPLGFEHFDIFKTPKILCTMTKHLAEQEYGPQEDEIWISG
jgi:hypothetical protein